MRPAQSLPAESSSAFLVIRDAVRGWDRFWFTPADPTTIAFMRICGGLLVFYVHLTYSWGLFGYVGPDAWIDQPLVRYITHEIPVYAMPFTWTDNMVQVANGNYYWSIFFHVTDPGWIVTLHIFFLTCMLLFTLGLWTRWTGALSWIGAMSYVQRASSTVFGLDTMMMIVLLYLMIAPAGATLSLDRLIQKWRARKRGELIPEVEPSHAANFALRLTQVHFCIIYLATGTSKLLGSTWWSGTALDLVLLNPSFAPMDQPFYYRLMQFLATHRWLWHTVTSLGIIYTLLVELAFPFLVWTRNWRWFMVCCSVLLHAGIGLCMGLTTFSLMMMIMVSSFLPAELFRGFGDRVAASVSGMFHRPGKVPTEHVGELALTR
jgi:hypothetical protein